MANHKEGCTWENVGIFVYQNNSNGPDSSISIDESGIIHNENEHQYSDNTYHHIQFNFCPICGCDLYD